MNPNQKKAELLRAAYDRNGSKPVAFIDESYQSRDQRPGDLPFYIATAMVILPEWHQRMREDLVDIAQSPFWHSTQAFQTEEGQDRLLKMIDYIAEGTEPIIVAVQVEIPDEDHDLEESRRTCLTSLASDLASGAHLQPVELMVIEQRHDDASRRRDEYIFDQARKASLLPRNTRAFQASPSYETLLWLPDIISYAKYREMAVSEERLFKPLAPLVRTIDVEPSR